MAVATRKRRAYRWLIGKELLHRRHNRTLSRWTELARTGAAIPIAQRCFTPEQAELLIGLTRKTCDDEVGIWDIDEALVAETDAACHHLAAVLRSLPH